MPLSLPETIRVLLPNGSVRKLPLEEYVRGVVAAALPVDAPLEAMKAQAVAARTFGASTRRHIERGADVCTLRHCQAWKEHALAAAARAAGATRGVVAVHSGRLIDAYYFEHCDGNTRDAMGMLMQAPPYLQGVACVCGFAALKGHGIGMCQRGAMVMARFGDKFDVILKHYYTGITLERVAVMPIATPPAPLPLPSRRSPANPAADDAARGTGPWDLELEISLGPRSRDPIPRPLGPSGAGPVGGTEGPEVKDLPQTLSQMTRHAARDRGARKVVEGVEREGRSEEEGGRVGSAEQPLEASPAPNAESAQEGQAPAEEKAKAASPAEEPPKAAAPAEEKAKAASPAEEPPIAAPPLQVAEPPPSPPVPIQAREPKAPKRASKTKKPVRTAKPRRAKKTARTSSPSHHRRRERREDKSKLSIEAAAAVPETTKTEQVVPTLQTETPVALDVVTHLPPAAIAPVVEPPKALEAVPAPTPGEAVSAVEIPQPQVPPAPVSAEATEVTGTHKFLEVRSVTVGIEAIQDSTTHGVEPEAQMRGEVGWYPVAEEIASGADKLEAELLDEALEASAATITHEVESAPIIPLGTASEEVGGIAVPARESPPAAPIEEAVKVPRAPDTMPEEMPVFPVASAPVEMPIAAPPPLLFEEVVGGTQSVAPSPHVLIDHLPGPRMIVGDLSKAGTIITIRDLDGHALITVSGAAPHHGAGGFEAPLASDGTYHVTFDHHALEINLKDETVFICYAG